MTGREKLIYCFANLAAALVALYVTLWLDLDRPYWAVFSVFIVSKPVSGAVRAKAIYRLVGTVIGASMSVFLVPPLVQSPVLLCLAVSLWIGICLYFALQDRTPRSYTFLLAGYSVAIVGLSTVNAPTSVFDVAVARLEEISIGIICASIAHSVIFPRSISLVIQDKAEAAIRHAAKVSARALGSKPVPPSTAEVATLATAIADLDALYAQIGLETSNVPRRTRVMDALLGRLAAVLPRASLICRSIAAAGREGLSHDTHATLKGVSTALAAIANGHEPVQAAIFAHTASAASGEAAALEGLIVHHVRLLSSELGAARQLSAALVGTGAAADLALSAAALPRRLYYRDRALALLSSAAAVAATLVACVLWIETAWPEGFVAAQFAAICCSLFATSDRPSKPIFAAVLGIAVVLPLAALYEFTILPSIDGFPSLALVLTPALLLFSFIQTFERLEGAAVVIAVAFFGALALQETFASDFASFVNANLAEMVGPLIAAAMLLIFRTIDPVWNARRMLNSSRAVLQRITLSPAIDPTLALMPLFDRTGQAAMRLSESTGTSESDILLDLRVLLNVNDLRHTERHFGGRTATHIDDALRQLGNLGPEEAGAARRSIANALARLLELLGRLPPTIERTTGMGAVVGLRLDLAGIGAEVMP